DAGDGLVGGGTPEAGRRALVGDAAGERDLVVDRVGEHPVDEDLAGCVVRDGDLVADDARIDDRGGRLEFRGDLRGHDHPLGLRFTARQSLRDVLGDLQDVNLARVALRAIVRAADVVEDEIRRQGTDDHRCDQDQRSARAHTQPRSLDRLESEAQGGRRGEAAHAFSYLRRLLPPTTGHRKCRGASARGTTYVAPQPTIGHSDPETELASGKFRLGPGRGYSASISVGGSDDGGWSAGLDSGKSGGV